MGRARVARMASVKARAPSVCSRCGRRTPAPVHCCSELGPPTSHTHLKPGLLYVLHPRTYHRWLGCDGDDALNRESSQSRTRSAENALTAHRLTGKS